MNKLRYTLDNLNQQLLERDIFVIDEVQYAIIETKGFVCTKERSIQKYNQTKSIYIYYFAISQTSYRANYGYAIYGQNLQQNNISRDWIEKQLYKQGAKHS
ncbi:hypothetical protein CHH91_07375 [Virgibacillus sp. 7505]|nr:hypothetical protein CHH91_07375 [Virgibacillus sp. 7505]